MSVIPIPTGKGGVICGNIFRVSYFCRSGYNRKCDLRPYPQVAWQNQEVKQDRHKHRTPRARTPGRSCLCHQWHSIFRVNYIIHSFSRNVKHFLSAHISPFSLAFLRYSLRLMPLAPPSRSGCLVATASSSQPQTGHISELSYSENLCFWHIGHIIAVLTTSVLILIHPFRGLQNILV